MATKVADLYADLSIRGDFDQRLAAGKQALQDTSKAADDSSVKVQQAAVKSANAYQRVSTEADKYAQAARKASQQASDAVERERIVRGRLADAVRKHGDESEQAVAAQKKLEAAQKDAARSAERAEKAQDNYTIANRRAASEASKAAAAMRDAESAMRGLDDATPDGSKLDSFFDALGQASTRGTEVAASRGGLMGSDFLGGFAAKIAGIGGKAGPIGAALVGVAAIGLTAGVALAKAIAEGAEKEAQQDLIQAKLGVDEATAARIGDAAGKAYTNAFGESSAANMDAARAAMQAGLLPRDADQGTIQKTIEQLNTVSEIMGADIPEVARAAGQAVRTGFVANGTEAMDLFVAATQAGLDTSGDLLETVVEYGTQFRQVGIQGADAMGLISQAMKGGARDTDVAADAIKEFAIRAQDGSESTAGAFEQLGLNADEMGDLFARGGDAARDGMDQILDKLRDMPDSVEKSQTAAALFGTQWEDLGRAFDNFDLSTARDELGKTAGATQEAADIIGGNAKASWESLTRTVESAVGGIKQSMAEAFGPTAADLSAKLLENKDEIVAFFADVVSAALTFGEGMANVAVAALHAWGFFAEGVGSLLSNMTGAIGIGGQALGSFISMIPGMEEKGESIKNVASTIAGLGDRMQESGDQAHGLANVIADDVIPGMANMRDRVAETGDAARASAAGMDILSTSVVAVPDEKTIIISDNRPETIAKLEALGLKVETLPDGTVKVTANTAEGERLVDEFVANNNNRSIDMFVNLRTTGTAQIDRVVQGSARAQADGSVREAQVSNRPILWGEAGPEAYIPLSPAKRPRSTNLLAEVADRFGYGLVRTMADGAITTDVQQSMRDALMGKFPDATISSGTRSIQTEGHADYHNAGKALDITGSDMLAIAQWIASAYPDSAELIHGGGFAHNIKDGKDVGDGMSFYGADQMAAHGDHVHWARTAVAGMSKGAPAPSVVDPNSKQGIANKIIAEGRKRGMSDAEIKSALMAGLAESGLQNLDHGDRDSLGVYQQRPSQGWGTREQITDVDYAIGKYYDSLAKVPGRETMSEAQMAQAVQRSAFADGSNYAAQSSEADALLAGYRDGSASSGAGDSSSGKAASGMPSSVSINGVVQVEVTNWPAALQGQERTPLYSANFKMFGAGGMHGPEVVRPGDYRVLGDSEGDESYIPHAPRYRARALGLWAETGKRLGVPGFAAGGVGFGGYTKDNSDYMAPKGLYDVVALGAGLGFTAYNAIAPYVAMAQSGRVDLGNLSPIIDTGANDLPGVASAIGEALQAQMEQVTAILQAILNRTPVEVNVEVDSGTGAAGIQLTKIGQ